MEFVDRLFAHRAFADPDLHRESTFAERSLTTFSITALYLPNLGDEATTEPAKDSE